MVPPLLTPFRLSTRTAFRINTGKSWMLGVSNRRTLHNLPPLPETLADGHCEPFLDRTTVGLLWNDFQRGLLERLNDEVKGTEFENSSVLETVIGTSQRPEFVQAFNFASQALNNHYFLSNLNPKLSEKEIRADRFVWARHPPPGFSERSGLQEALVHEYESIPSFKLAFSSAAYGMSGSGWVWLVMDSQGRLGIVPTFAAGTVLAQNRHHTTFPMPQGSINDNVSSSNASNASESSNAALSSKQPPSAHSSKPRSPSSTETGVRAYSTTSVSKNSVLGSGMAGIYAQNPLWSSSRPLTGGEARLIGEKLSPLLCISVHEHAWLPRYGMWGKEEYLMRFWEAVDWVRVERTFNTLKGLR